MNADFHTQPVRAALKLAGASRPADAIGESRRKAAILNDAFSKLHACRAFRAFETGHAGRVAVQFRAEGGPSLVEVDALRFIAFLKAHPRCHEIRAALGRKMDWQRSKLSPNHTQI